MNRKEGLILLWLVFATILGGSFYGVAQEDEKIERKISRDRQPPTPPAKVKGEETEIVYDNPFFSKNPDKKENYEVYLDKFVVWTTDTTAVYSILENSDFVISHRESEPGIHRMECSVGDPKLGKRLRAKLKKEPKVIRVSNFYYSSQYESEYRPEDYVTIRLKNAGDSIRLKEIADSIGGYIRCSSAERGVWELFLGRCKSTAIEIANELYEAGFTEWVDAGIVYEVFLDFSYDPEVSKQWYLYNTKNISIPPANKYTDLEVSSAWNYATGRGIKICVIDTEFDIENEDLKGHIIKCYDAAREQDTIYVKGTHGTSCAGVAGAIRNNNYGISGIAPDADLMLVRYSDSIINGKGVEQQMATAMEWAWKNGADIISCSWSLSREYEKLSTTISNALKFGRSGKGCVVVKSSGNTGNKITYPGYLPGVIAVGAVDSNANVWPNSCYGDSLWVVAPGVNIYCLINDGKFGYSDGTSLSAPCVAGVAALVLQVYPEATSDEVRRIIGLSAKLPDGIKADSLRYINNEDSIVGKFWNKKYGFGLVNAYQAVSRACSLKKRWTLQTPEISNPTDLLEHL